MTGSHPPPDDLMVDTGSDAWVNGMTPPSLPSDLALILQNPQGANLDIETIQFLSDSGVYDAHSFIRLTQEPFSELLGTLSDTQFL